MNFREFINESRKTPYQIGYDQAASGGARSEKDNPYDKKKNPKEHQDWLDGYYDGKDEFEG